MDVLVVKPVLVLASGGTWVVMVVAAFIVRLAMATGLALGSQDSRLGPQ